MNKLFYLAMLIAPSCSFEALNSMELPQNAPDAFNELGKEFAREKSFKKKIEISQSDATRIDEQIRKSFFTKAPTTISQISEASQSGLCLYVCTGCKKGHIFLGRSEITSCRDCVKNFAGDDILKHITKADSAASFSPSEGSFAYLTNMRNKKYTDKIFLAWRTQKDNWRRNTIDLDLPLKDSVTYPEKAKIAFIDEQSVAAAFLTNYAFFNIYSLTKKQCLAQIGLGDTANPHLFQVMNDGNTIWCGTLDAQIEVYKKRSPDQWSKELTYAQPESSNDQAFSIPSRISVIAEINPQGIVAGIEQIKPHKQNSFVNILAWCPEKDLIGFQTPVSQFLSLKIAPEGKKIVVLYRNDDEPLIGDRTMIIDLEGEKCFKVSKALKIVPKPTKSLEKSPQKKPSAKKYNVAHWKTNESTLSVAPGQINLPYAYLGLNKGTIRTNDTDSTPNGN